MGAMTEKKERAGGRGWLSVLLVLPLLSALWLAVGAASAADAEKAPQADRVELSAATPLDSSALADRWGGALPSDTPGTRGPENDRTAIILWDESKRMRAVSAQAPSGQMKLTVNGRTF